MRQITTDVLVIGSGFGAAAPALRLAQAGLSVTMIEKGPWVGQQAFRQTQDPKYLLRYLKGLGGGHLGLTYAEALGGGSGFYEMVSLRAPSLVFQYRGSHGERLWPTGLDRAVLDPWYDRAEAMLKVEQIRMDEIPKSGLVFAQLMKNLGYSVDRARYAVQGCLGSGFCVTGCVYGAKQSLHVNYLPQAVAAGATVACEVEALGIRPLDEIDGFRRSHDLSTVPARYAVRCRRGGPTGEVFEFIAKLVVLGGGTVGTAKLLLASRADLPRLSQAVGRHLAFNGSVKLAGLLPPSFPDADMFAGRSHPGMISYQFLESDGITISAGKPFPLQAVAAARLSLDGDPRQPAYWGEANVELMQQYRRRMIVLASFGLTPPSAELDLKPHGGLSVSLTPTPGLEQYVERVQSILRRILTENSCQLVDTEFVDHAGSVYQGIHFSTAHQVGSCRMADDPDHGVVDRDGEVFGYPGIYVSDGAAIPTSLAVNTSLTILANAERIAASILQCYRLPIPTLAAAG
jgi:choline dehydrogenase-like flavoprotein